MFCLFIKCLLLVLLVMRLLVVHNLLHPLGYCLLLVFDLLVHLGMSLLLSVPTHAQLLSQLVDGGLVTLAL